MEIIYCKKEHEKNKKIILKIKKIKKNDKKLVLISAINLYSFIILVLFFLCVFSLLF